MAQMTRIQVLLTLLIAN